MEQNNRLPIFRERLEKLRKLMGSPSNTEFAKTIGISRQTLGFYLNGDRIPDCETLAQICLKCNTSADWLLGLSEDPSIESTPIDKLGLSPKAVDNLKRYCADSETASAIDGLNMLLEIAGTFFLTQKIKRLADSIDLEREYSEKYLSTEYNPAESCLPASTFMDISNMDLCESLEQEIITAHPELAGRIALYCGRSAIDIQIQNIIEQFDYALKRITGYFDYLED